MPVGRKPGFTQAGDRALGQISILKTTAGENHTRLTDPLRDVRHDCYECVVKFGRDYRIPDLLSHVIKDLPNHRFPVDDHGLPASHNVVEAVHNVGRGSKFELHGSLSFERNAIAYADQGCNSIEQPADA